MHGQRCLATLKAPVWDAPVDTDMPVGQSGIGEVHQPHTRHGLCWSSPTCRRSRGFLPARAGLC